MSENRKFYWFRTCPNCLGQGRLIITEDVTNRRLYLHCEECEIGWLDPETVNDRAKGFLTLVEEFETVNPSLERIRLLGWEKYAQNSFSEVSVD
jgi:hypothetical protein